MPQNPTNLTNLPLSKAEYDALPRRYSNRKTHLTYELAKMVISVMAPEVKSSSQYAKWHKSHKIAFLPAYPPRIYPNFSWNDFLDADTRHFWDVAAENKRRAAIVHRPMWEAIRWAQAYCRKNNILTRRDWEKHYRQATDIPEDIPIYPNRVYKSDDYPGFRIWCGRDATGLSESIGKVTPVVALVHVVDKPQNVVALVSSSGKSDFIGLWQKQRIYDRVLGCWEIEDDTKSQMDHIMANFGVSDGEYTTVANLHALLWELNSHFSIVKL